MLRSKIVATGAYIPALDVPNDLFIDRIFFDSDQKAIAQPTETVIRKFSMITGIKRRRYAPEGTTASDMGTLAAQQAIARAGIDPESIDRIIVAHNYGDMKYNGVPRDMVPSLASRIKHKLAIKSTKCIPYDIIFGCPGWLQGFIQADQAIRAGDVGTCLVIGTETLSRVLDPTDRDSMIFSDGAGACIIQSSSVGNSGVINTAVRSDTSEELEFIYSAGSNEGYETDLRFIKMKGRKVYEYALKYVPQAMKDCFDCSGEDIRNLKMIFIHQANEKMDEAIVKRFFELYNIGCLPENIMPMNISTMGNSSVATIPTLLHQVSSGQMDMFRLSEGDLVIFASVGAGMSINAMTYRW
jgi:3-oxoacyl-[acyl-carrier-protein] synthase-3